MLGIGGFVSSLELSCAHSTQVMHSLLYFLLSSEMYTENKYLAKHNQVSTKKLRHGRGNGRRVSASYIPTYTLNDISYFCRFLDL